MINLVAVQARMARTDYESDVTFAAKIGALMEKVADAADLSRPTLVAFPELIGMFLSFVPRYWDDLKDESSLEMGATKIVMKNLASIPEQFRTSPESAARRLLFVDTAVETENTYTSVFSGLAREHGCYIAAGSIALPPMEAEPSKGGRHVADDSRVYNTAYLFSPLGVCLARTPKVNLVPGFEERVFDPAPVSDVLPVNTAIGRIGTLVCLDGFHGRLLERFDAMGVQILLKPSYNQHPWDGPSSYEPDHKEGENWLNTGCPSIIQGRENIRYGVNPMLVGDVFDDMYAEGLSSIAQNTGRPGASWEDGVIAIASRPDAEEIVVAAIERLSTAR